MTMTPQHCRAARGFLGWTIEDLASYSGLSTVSITGYENEKKSCRKESVEAITGAFEYAGIEFTSNGIRKRGMRLDVRRYEGDIVYETMLDDIFETARQTGSEILISCLSERLFARTDLTRQLMKRQVLRLREHRITERVLVKEHDRHFMFPPDITTYRWLASNHFGMAPSITYGDKVAFVTFTYQANMMIVESADLADSHRKQFEVLWSVAKPIPFSDDEVAAICHKNLPLD